MSPFPNDPPVTPPTELDDRIIPKEAVTAASPPSLKPHPADALYDGPDETLQTPESRDEELTDAAKDLLKAHDMVTDALMDERPSEVEEMLENATPQDLLIRKLQRDLNDSTALVTALMGSDQPFPTNHEACAHDRQWWNQVSTLMACYTDRSRQTVEHRRDCLRYAIGRLVNELGALGS